MLRGFVTRCCHQGYPDIVARIPNTGTNWALFTIIGFEFLTFLPGENRTAYYLALDKQSETETIHATDGDHTHD